MLILMMIHVIKLLWYSSFKFINDVNTKEFMEKMGFKTAPSYEGYNRGGMIPVDSILAIKYQIA